MTDEKNKEMTIAEGTDVPSNPEVNKDKYKFSVILKNGANITCEAESDIDSLLEVITTTQEQMKNPSINGFLTLGRSIVRVSDISVITIEGVGNTDES